MKASNAMKVRTKLLLGLIGLVALCAVGAVRAARAGIAGWMLTTRLESWR